MEITHFQFGVTEDNQPVRGIRISNHNQYSMKVINWGATLISFQAPDQNGIIEEITLGFKDFKEYEQYSPYFGSTVGRVANRIKDGRFRLNGCEYQLDKNQQGMRHLHGGNKGLSRAIWEIDSQLGVNQANVFCTITSNDGDQGYPGNMEILVRYTLTETNQLIITYDARTDQLSPINLTNHTYWNLAGNGSDTILDHRLAIHCDHYLPVDEYLIPTGEILPVDGSAWDFRRKKRIREDIDAIGGYDHCFVRTMDRSECGPVAGVYEPYSGRTMDLSTTEPGVQFYSGNNLDAFQAHGINKHQGFCLETQFFPDAVNREEFPSILLKPGELYHQRTVHSFGTGQ